MSIKAFNWVLKDVTVDPATKMILIALADNADDCGVTFPSMALMARKASVNVRTVMRKIQFLEDHGLVKVTTKHAGWNKSRNSYVLMLNMVFDLGEIKKNYCKLRVTNCQVVGNEAGKKADDKLSGVQVTESHEFDDKLSGGQVTLVSGGQVTELCHPNHHINHHINHSGSSSNDGPEESEELFAMTVGWKPTPIVYLELTEEFDIPTSFSENCIPEFRVFWRKKPQLSQESWDGKFVTQVRYRWEHDPHRPKIEVSG